MKREEQARHDFRQHQREGDAPEGHPRVSSPRSRRGCLRRLASISLRSAYHHHQEWRTEGRQTWSDDDRAVSERGTPTVIMRMRQRNAMTITEITGKRSHLTVRNLVGQRCALRQRLGLPAGPRMVESSEAAKPNLRCLPQPGGSISVSAAWPIPIWCEARGAERAMKTEC